MSASTTERQGLKDFFAKIGVTFSGCLPGTAASVPANPSGAVATGGRNNEIVRLAGQLIRAGNKLEAVKHQASRANKRFSTPLDETEVNAACDSIWRTHMRNTGQDEAGPVAPLFDISEARIDRYLTTPAPPRRWIFKDFIPKGIVAAVISPGGMGKSQLLMQIAYSACTGIPLAGHWPVGEAGSVLMLCAEDETDEIHRRVARIHTQLGKAMTRAELAQLGDRLHIKSLVGEDVQLTTIGFGNEATKTDICARLALTVQQLDDVKLIIIDPASRFRGGEENSNAHATRFVSALEGLVKATGATVLIAHHANKASTFGSDKRSQNSSRGASALTDGIRLQLSLSPIARARGHQSSPQADPSHLLELSVDKTNYTAPQPPVLLRRESDGYLSAGSAQGMSGGTREAKATIDLLYLIATVGITVTARQVEQNYCGPNNRIEISQKECRQLIDQAHADSLLIKMARRPLALTTQGRSLIAANPPMTVAAGAARRQRVPRNRGAKSTT